MLLLPSSVLAADAERALLQLEQRAHHGSHVVLGMKGVSTVERMVADNVAATFSGYGFASVVETTLLEGRLGLELDFVFTAPGNELSMSGEPMIKLPWHLRTWLEPYVATGPMAVSIRDDRGHHVWLGGGQVVLGAFVWLAEMAGLDIDLALGVAYGAEMSMAEMTVAIGPVLRD